MKNGKLMYSFSFPRGACVMDTVIGNGHGNLSSNLRRGGGCISHDNTLGKSISLIVPLPTMDK